MKLSQFPCGLANFWEKIKNKPVFYFGFGFFILGVLGILIQFFLVLLRTDFSLLSISLGLMSVGLGAIAITMARESDKRYTEILERLDRNVALLPTILKEDVLTLSGRLVAREAISTQNKKSAQKRLDEDTKNVGYVRGEIFQTKDGSWAIHWGGKYPL